MSPRRRSLSVRAACCAAVAAVAACLTAGAPAARAELGYPAVEHAPDRTALLSEVVDEMLLRKTAGDRRYMSAGQLVGVGSGCWPCRVGPAVGAAALVGARPGLLPDVVAMIDRAIADHRLPNGSFGSGIDTAWFTNVLGMTYLAAEPHLDAATRARWSAAVAAAADYLVAQGNLSYYTNGNINLAITQSLWLAARVTGDSRFLGYFESSWAFTMSPPQAQWPGFGLRLTVSPTRPDWGDGVGYLAESAGGAPGFDPEYIQLQLDVAASLYVVSRDERFLRLMNLLVNSVLPRVSPALALDARNGMRKSSLLSFLTPALSVLVASGSRPDLGRLLEPQFARSRTDYAALLATADESSEPGFYRGVGTWLAVPVIDANYRAAVAQSTPVTPQAPAPAPEPTTRRRSRMSCAAASRRVSSARTRRARRQARRQLRACRARVRARTRAERRRASGRTSEHGHRRRSTAR